MEHQLSTHTSSHHQPLPAPSIQWGEILSLLWRGRWMILGCFVLGLMAAVYIFKTSFIYQSESKLLVKYIRESSALDSRDVSVSDISENGQTEGASWILNNEVEILISSDILGSVADRIGYKRLVPDSKKPVTKDDAIGMILKTLAVHPLENTSVIGLNFSHPNQDVTHEVLVQLLDVYTKKHLEIHRPAEVAAIQARADISKQQLAQIEHQIQEIMSSAGVVSSAVNLDVKEKRRSDLRAELYKLEAEIAASEAKLISVSPNLGSNHSSDSSLPSASVIQRYQDLLNRIADLRTRNLQLSAKFTPSSNLVARNRGLIQGVENERQALVDQYPSLVSKTSLTRQEQVTKNKSISQQVADLSALKAKSGVLRSQLAEFEAQLVNLPVLMSKLKRLEGDKAEQIIVVREVNTALQKALSNAALDASKVNNLKVVEAPSVPDKVVSPTASLLMKVLALGGLLTGLGLTFVKEKFLVKKIQRPEDVENHFGIPVDLAIPYIGRISRGLPPLESYARDVIDVISNGWNGSVKQLGPKMIGFPGVGSGVGATTITNHVASALRKQGEKVLVLTYKDVEGQTLDNDFIKSLQNQLKEDYVLNDSMMEAKRFKLMPAVLSSFDYDYVLFDMPLTGAGIPTNSISKLFHKVILVISPDASERTDIVQVYNELMAAEANVACVFNKERVSGKNPRTFKSSRVQIRPIQPINNQKQLL